MLSSWYCGIPLKTIGLFHDRHFKLPISLIVSTPLGFRASFRWVYISFYFRATFLLSLWCGPSGVTTDCLVYLMRFFHSCWKELVEILAPYQFWKSFVLQLPGNCLSLEVVGWSQEILPFSCTSFYLAKFSREPSFKLLELFPSSLELCPINSSHLCLLALFLCLLKSTRLLGSICVLFLLCWSGKLLPAWEPWVMVRLILFLPLFSVFCPAMPMCKNSPFQYFILCSSCLQWEDYSGPVTPSWPEMGDNYSTMSFNANILAKFWSSQAIIFA